MIRVEELCVKVDQRILIQGLSFDVAPKEKAVLVGASGSGKTSVLRTILGIHRLDRGRIIVGGLELGLSTINDIRRRLAYVPQSPSYFEDQSTYDYLMYPFQLQANRKDSPSEKSVEGTIDRFGLHRSVLKSRMDELSGGERQRLSLVRVLLLDREILLLDEVTSALDSGNRRIILDAILFEKERTVLAVTHDDEWIEAAHRRIKLGEDHGKS